MDDQLKALESEIANLEAHLTALKGLLLEDRALVQ